jgi:flagellar hook-basal body complex protein FliE
MPRIVPGITAELELRQATPSPEIGNGFADALRAVARPATEAGAAAEQAIVRLATGEGQDLHQSEIAMQKADLAFQWLLQVRNKVLQAYQEIMQMQV